MRIFICFMLVMLSNASFAEMSQEELREVLSDRISGLEMFVKNSVFTSAVREQNMKKTSLDDIKKIDEEWKAGVSPLIKELQKTKAGKFIKNIIVQQADVYSEAFLTDIQGANVAAYPTTSDYWQGDEEKFTNSFNGGNGQIFVGGVEYDESSKTNAVQISLPVKYGNNTIGVFVVGVKITQIEADKLAAKLAAKGS